MERNARPGVVRRVVSGVWGTVDRLRQASLNLLFIAVAVFFVAGWWASRPAPLPADAALLVAPNGTLVEQRSAKSPISLLQGGDGIHQVLLRDVVDAIHAAATDSRIKVLVVETDGLSGAGLSKLQEIAAAIGEFRKAGQLDATAPTWLYHFTRENRAGWSGAAAAIRWRAGSDQRRSATSRSDSRAITQQKADALELLRADGEHRSVAAAGDLHPAFDRHFAGATVRDAIE